MGPSAYDRMAAWLRITFRRRPIASVALALACAWILLNVYETLSNWSSASAPGWFEAVTTMVSLSAIGVLLLAALAWLVEYVFADHPR